MTRTHDLTRSTHALVRRCVDLPASLMRRCAARRAQVRDWPSERPPRSLPARDIKFPPYQIRTLPNGLQVVAVLHHEQPAVSMRMLVGDRAARRIRKASSGSRGCSRRCSIRGRTTRVGEGRLNDAIDSIGGAMGAGAASDLSFVNMVVMKDSFEPGMRMLADMVERPAFAPEEIDRQRQQLLSLLRVSLEDPGVHRERSGRSSRVRLQSVRDAGHRHAGDDGGDHAERPARVPSRSTSCRTTPSSRLSATSRPRKRSTRRRRCLASWKSREVVRERFVEPPNSTRRVIVVDKPDSVADRDPRGEHRHPAQPPRLHGAQSGHPHPRRRGQQSPASGAADRPRADLRRAGRHGDAQGERRDRGGNQHALRRHR